MPDELKFTKIQEVDIMTDEKFIIQKTVAEVVSMRDQFAMAALTGLIEQSIAGDVPPKDISRMSYVIADAMMEARENT